MQQKTKRRIASGDEVRIHLRGSWTAIPNDLLRDSNLPPPVRLLGALLHVYAGNTGHCFPLQNDLADILGVHSRTVQLWLDKLTQHHYATKRRTLRGNLYTLTDPNKVLTNTILGSHADTILGSHADTILGSHADTILGSHADTILGSHASLLSQTHDSESDSPTPEGPPAHPGDDDGGPDSIRNQTPTGKYLQILGITAWQELQESLRHVPYERVKARVDTLQGQGVSLGIIVASLRKVPFLPMPGDGNGNYANFRSGGDISDLPPDLDEGA